MSLGESEPIHVALLIPCRHGSDSPSFFMSEENMTNETCAFDSAEDKAEWEETHFGMEDEDEAFERERAREYHEMQCDHIKAFNDWLMKNGFEERPDNRESIDMLRNAFFAGAAYGIDECAKLYRR